MGSISVNFAHFIKDFQNILRYVLRKGNNENYTTATEPPIFWNCSYRLVDVENKVTSSIA